MGETILATSRRRLQEAAEPTLARIRRDAARASHRIQPLLACLEEHLFDADLDVNELKRRCGVRDNSLPTLFHAELGLPPYGYLEDCRMETACRFLASCDLDVWRVSQLLGYSSIQVFSRAFHRVTGLSPSSFRKSPGPLATKPHWRLEKASEPAEELSFQLAADAGVALRGPELESLLRRVLEAHPASAETIARLFREQALHGVAPRDEEARAEKVWRRLEELPRTERRTALRDRLERTASPALLRLLRERARQIGQQDPWGAMAIAELALDVAEAIPHLPRRLPLNPHDSWVG